MDNMNARPAPRTETRDRILDGLSVAIAERGLTDVTVADVLRCAGVSRRTYYQYFGGLQPAVLELYQQMAADLAQRVLSAISSHTELTTQVLRGATTYLDFQLQGGPALYALQREAAIAGTPLNALHEAVLEQIVAFLVTETERAAGLAPDPLVYRGLLLGIEAVVLHKQREGSFSVADRDHVARVLEPFLLGVLRSAPSWARVASR